MSSEKEIKKDSVCIMMPCGAPIEPNVAQSLLLVALGANNNGYPVRQVGMTNRTLIDTARNELAKEFMNTDCEWSFWMDSDMILQPDTIPVMIKRAKELDAKFLSGVYCRRMGDHRPLLWRRKLVAEDETVLVDHAKDDRWVTTDVIIHPDKKQPFKVDACGFGCCLIHRSVYEQLKFPYFQAFWTDWHDKKIQVSEDFYFCTMAREAGIPLWIIPELKCGHLGFGKVYTINDCTLMDNPSVMLKE
jgi:GT2 family glycosyltransferase